jgi:hypothetical protein
MCKVHAPWTFWLTRHRAVATGKSPTAIAETKVEAQHKQQQIEEL